MSRVKFKVVAVRKSQYQNHDSETNQEMVRELATIEMQPVCPGNDPAHENYKFWESTPTGHLELGCIHATAAEQFEIGKEYYLDFVPA